jgi:hypothetical protein
MAAIDAKSEPLKHAITSTGSPNKALVVAVEFHGERSVTLTCHMQVCHQCCRSRSNFATMAAIDAKSEPLKHAITSAGSPNKALVGAL